MREPAMTANAHEILALAASHDVYVGLCVGGLEELAVREVRAALLLPAGLVAALDSGYDVVLVAGAERDANEGRGRPGAAAAAAAAASASAAAVARRRDAARAAHDALRARRRALPGRTEEWLAERRRREQVGRARELARRGACEASAGTAALPCALPQPSRKAAPGQAGVGKVVFAVPHGAAAEAAAAQRAAVRGLRSMQVRLSARY